MLRLNTFLNWWRDKMSLIIWSLGDTVMPSDANRWERGVAATRLIGNNNSATAISVSTDSLAVLDDGQQLSIYSSVALKEPTLSITISGTTHGPFNIVNKANSLPLTTGRQTLISVVFYQNIWYADIPTIATEAITGIMRFASILESEQGNLHSVAVTPAGLSAKLKIASVNNSTCLNGQTAAYYLNASNLNAGTVSRARLPVVSQVYDGMMCAADKLKLDEASIYYNKNLSCSIMMRNSSNATQISQLYTGEVDNKKWIDTTYYTGCSANSDKLRGKAPETAVVGDTIAVRTGSGALCANHYYSDAPQSQLVINSIITENGDGWFRKSSLAYFNSAITNEGDQNRDIRVSKYMRWAKYGNNHVLIDASAGVAPNGCAINSINSNSVWSNQHISLMGWNGNSTYGVRVDTARYAETAQVANTVASILATVPVGFVYTQYPGTPTPMQLWGGTENQQWKIISSSFGGRFARIEGGNPPNISVAFNANNINANFQNDGAPNIGGTFDGRPANIGGGFAASGSVTMASGWDKGYKDAAIISFYASRSHRAYGEGSTEVRPYNVTVRIWQRI